MDRIIDGRATTRQHILQLLREVCAGASALCDNPVGTSGLWHDRAKSAIRSCVLLQRGLNNSHPQVADGLHMLATEIQIALAAHSDETLFAMRIQKIRDAIHRVQQTNVDSDGATDP